MTKNKIIIFSWVIVIISVLSAYIFQGSRSLIFRVAILFALGLGIISLFFYRSQVSEQMKRGKQARMKLIESGAVLFFGIAVYMLVNSFDLNIDWTAQRLFQISPQTKNIISKINEPLEIMLFTTKNSDDPKTRGVIQYAERMAQRYVALNPQKISFTTIDPIRNKSLADRYRIAQNGTVIFKMGDRVEFVLPTLLVEQISENNTAYKAESIFTAVIDKLIENKTTTIYYLTGQGELDFSSQGSLGYNSVLKLFEDRRYVVKALNLNHYPDVPEDANIVIVADPQANISANVFSAMDKYLKQGGSTLYLLSSSTTVDINPLIFESGFAFIPNTAVDPSLTAKNSGALSIIPMLSPRSEITSALSQKSLSVLFPSVSIISVLTTNYMNQDYIYDIYPLARMSKHGFGETSFEKGLYEKGEGDIEGITTLAIASIAASKENPELQRRSVAIGSLDFIDNSRINTGGNAQFLLNSIDFLLKNDLQTTVPSKSQDLTVSVASPSALRTIFVSTIIWVLFWLVFAINFLIIRQNKVKEKK